MKGHHTKDEASLVYDANKRYIRAVGQTILARLLNEALTQMSHDFLEGVTVGEVRAIQSFEAVEELLVRAARRQLGAAE